MLFASSDDVLLVWLIIIPFAMHGFRKMARSFDDKGEIKKAAQNQVVGLIGRLFKK
ncbi:MAG TPA: hypothetical protein VN688_26765 [Gemmataceae bacterium]|nr:hypothetical protein [Gemmataceae bacterium]